MTSTTDTNENTESNTESTVKRSIDLINPFIVSAEDAWSTMLQSACVRGDVQRVVDGHHMKHMTSTIGISGGMAGAISISMDEQTAQNILFQMTGLESEGVDEFVRDAVGEMANIVAGKGKRDLEDFSLKISLPQVIIGQDYTVYAPRWAMHVYIPFTSELGDFTLDVGFDRNRRS